MAERCNCIRTAKNPKKHPGQQSWYRCRKEATLRMLVHQTPDHLCVGTGWFEIHLCDRCFDEGQDTTR